MAAFTVATFAIRAAPFDARAEQDSYISDVPKMQLLLPTLRT